MSIPAVFASDYDKTIYFSDRDPQVSPDLIPAVEEFRKLGGLFGFCSGRPADMLESWAENTPSADFTIGSSGARILDSSRKLIYEKHMSLETARALLDFIDETVTGYSIHVNGFFGVLDGTKERYVTEEGFLHMNALEDLYDDELIHDISYRTNTAEDAAVMAEKVNAAFGDRVTAFQNINYIDIVPAGCSKGEGLLRIKELYQAEKAFGIGDAGNDIPLLDDADTSFTFHTSPEHVQAHASLVVDKIEEAVKIASEQVRSWSNVKES